MRNRIIKEGFFCNYELAQLPPLVRILFQGLWCLADKEGRLLDRPPQIKVKCLPYDDIDPHDALQKLHDSGFIVRYEIDGLTYIQVVNFKKHQTLTTWESKNTVSEIPACPQITVLQKGVSSSTEVLQREAEQSGTEQRDAPNGDAGASDEPTAAGRDASPEMNASEMLRVIWQEGVRLLCKQGGVAERDARNTLGRYANDYGKEALAAAILVTMKADTPDPIVYLSALMKKGIRLGKDAKPSETRQQRNLSSLRKKVEERKQQANG